MGIDFDYSTGEVIYQLRVEFTHIRLTWNIEGMYYG